MQDLDRTTRMRGPGPIQEPTITGGLLVTIFDGMKPPKTYRLDDYSKRVITFGRGSFNDIQLDSPVVSNDHGRFVYANGQWIIEDRAVFGKEPSSNGLMCNHVMLQWRALCEGDFIRIDDGVETVPEGVLFVFYSENTVNRWNSIPIGQKPVITIGRDPGCDVVLPHISVSKFHARIFFENGAYFLADNGSTNGVVINNQRITGTVRLHEKDVITITNSKLIFTSSMLSWCCYRSGISVEASHIVIRRKHGRKKIITGNDISLNIRPGELVSIIGGSGAGKSTILNCLCGYLPPDSGIVQINGIDLYENFESLKKLIGYVPQSDIVYDNLTLYDMLKYTARLRLPKDTADAEMEAAINRAIQMVELSEKKNSYIRSLSGGQRKRASIAVELLSDPNLLFLDEPASGLDPGTERNLMLSLRRMADNGKTVILVTHSTLQLKMCDRIVFMGNGGNLCYFGSYDDAMRFFEVQDVVDVYQKLNEEALTWKNRYGQIAPRVSIGQGNKRQAGSGRGKKRAQLPILSERYAKLVWNDKIRLLLLVVLAPVLAFLISLVADGKQFEQYESTKSLLFCISCAAFWVGMMNAIREICKERSIIKREYMTGLSLTSYTLSKILVLGVICLFQSGLIILIFSLIVGLPEKGVFLPPFLELLLTTFLTELAATSMGLLVSALFNNGDRAMTIAPVLVLPQILFSGLIFSISGATEVISGFVICRWSMEGYGTTANLNGLTTKIQEELTQFPIERMEAEAFFTYDTWHLIRAWLLLLAFAAVFLVLTRLIMTKIGKEKA